MRLTTKKMDWNNWNSGRMEKLWDSIGIMELWNDGRLEKWNNAMMIHCKTGWGFVLIIVPIFHHSSIPTFSSVLWLAHST